MEVDLDQLNRRTALAMRGVMSAWARRWRVIRREREAGDIGRVYIEKAIKCRDIARNWTSTGLC